MMNRLFYLLALCAVMTAPVLAQDQRVEVSLLAGWAFAEGVAGAGVASGEGNVDNRVDPKSAFKWGAGVGVLVSEEAELGFRFGRQQSTLRAGGTNTLDIGDMNVDTYHGYFAYNFGDAGSAVRPYLLGGLGVTHFGAVEYALSTGRTGTIGGVTRFSSAWGAGVKAYAATGVGVNVGVQWTPTYVKSNSAGWWCDVFWGCYVVGSADYANQFDISGGITFRF